MAARQQQRHTTKEIRRATSAESEGEKDKRKLEEVAENGSIQHVKRGTLFGKSIADDGDIMDKILFEDESRAGEYLKGLISSQGLRGAWEKLSKRMKNLEEACGTKRDHSAMTAEERGRAFATRQECQEIVIEEYAGPLSKHESRLESLEAAADAALRRFEVNEKGNDVRNELARCWETIAIAQQDILEVKLQDETHHQEVLDLHQQLAAEISTQEASAGDACRAISDRQFADVDYRVDLESALQELKDFLYSAGLQKQLEKIASEMLLQYVSWEDMKHERLDIHQRAVKAATEPLAQDIEQLRDALEASSQSLSAKDNVLNEDISQLSDKVTSINTRLVDRIDDVVAQVQQRAMDTRLSEVEKRLLARDEFMETDFVEFKELQTRKIEDSFDRVQELESTIFAHEHALQHWAEEIGNRATKYDMMVVSARVEKCHLKDKADIDFKEVQKTLKWQSVKIENLTFKSNFGGNDGAPRRRSSRRRDRGSSKDKDKPVEEESEGVPASEDDMSRTPTDSRPPSSAKEQIDRQTSGGGEKGQTRADATKLVKRVSVPSPVGASPVEVPIWGHQPDTEHMAMIHHQLESLAHCVLGLSHLSLRTAVCGLSREAKIHSEERLTFNIKSLLYWITHRAAPPDWDPLELQTLAIKVIDNNEERAESRHSLHRQTSEGLRDQPRTPRVRAQRYASGNLEHDRPHSEDHTEFHMGERVTAESDHSQHMPSATAHRVQEHRQNTKERAERRQQQWVEKGTSGSLRDAGTAHEIPSTQSSLEGAMNPSTSSTRKGRTPGSSTAASSSHKQAYPGQGQDRRPADKKLTGERPEAVPPQRMRELVMDVFGNQDSAPPSRQVSTAKVSGHLVRGRAAGDPSASPEAAEQTGTAATSDLALPRLQVGNTPRR